MLDNHIFQFFGSFAHKKITLIKYHTQRILLRIKKSNHLANITIARTMMCHMRNLNGILRDQRGQLGCRVYIIRPQRAMSYNKNLE